MFEYDAIIQNTRTIIHSAQAGDYTIVSYYHLELHSNAEWTDLITSLNDLGKVGWEAFGVISKPVERILVRRISHDNQ